jgi:putative transposase
MQNAYIERKNGSIRRELLNTYLFNSLAEVRILSEEWRVDYNSERPHKSLGYLSPLQYAQLNMAMQLYPHRLDETLNKIEAQPVVDKAVKSKNTKFENAN